MCRLRDNVHRSCVKGVALFALTRFLLVLPAEAIVLGAVVDPNSKGPMAEIQNASLLLRGDNGLWCSATLIGTRAILTSAHCRGLNDSILGKIGSATYSMRCSRPGSSVSPELDIAICVSDRPLAGLSPIAIDVSDNTLPGAKLYLAGYGCRVAGGIDSSVGTLSIGEVHVLADGSDVSNESQAFTVVGGGAACFGDSGGGAFKVDPIHNNRPVLVGMISRTDFESKTWLVALRSRPVRELFSTWSRSLRVGICGLETNRDACGIRGSTPATKDSAEDYLVAHTVVLQTLRGDAGDVVPAPPKPERTYVVSRKGETIVDVFLRACGPSAEQFLKGRDIAETFRDLTASTQTALSGEIVAIPSCPANTSPPSLKPQQLNHFEDRRWQTTLASAGSASIDYFGLLAADDQNAGATLPGLPQNAPKVAVGSPVIEPILGWSGDGGPADCGGSGQDPVGSNLGTLLDVLALNHLVRDPVPVAILVADSGLQGPGRSGFSPKVLWHRDDIDWRKYTDLIEPIVLDEKGRKHGTQVASIALGGPAFFRMQLYFGAPKIFLAVSRIYRTTAPAGTGVADLAGASTSVDFNLFDSLLSDAVDRNARIINLSLRSTVPIVAIDRELQRGGAAGLLFVVAAGNQNKQISENPTDQTEAIYPALYGGYPAKQVITVTALDSNGDRAKFANWGARYVDIGAVGCQVTALSWNADSGRFATEFVSGTSMAAPLVSFTAALILSESGGTWSPAQIKRRILMAADLNFALPGSIQIQDGRKLNIVKAVSIQNDVVETNSGTLLFGRLTLTDDGREMEADNLMGFNCERLGRVVIKRNDLLKIARKAVVGAELKFAVYWKDKEHFAQDTCASPNYKVGIYDFLKQPLTSLDAAQVKDAFVPLEWSQIKDITFKL
jgi:subtilisin family serine protease